LRIIDLVISDVMGLLGISICLGGRNPGVVDVIMWKPDSSIMELTLTPSWDDYKLHTGMLRYDRFLHEIDLCIISTCKDLEDVEIS